LVKRGKAAWPAFVQIDDKIATSIPEVAMELYEIGSMVVVVVLVALLLAR
jgi:hypothetical protein